MSKTSKEVNEIKRCPFCGSEAEVNEFPEDDGYGNAGGYCVTCKQCFASSRVHLSVKESGKPHAISAWNRRSTQGDGT